MSLLALTIGLDKAALGDLVGFTATVNQYAHNDDDNITKALNAFTDAFRSAAIKGGYTAASVDALTSLTCPDSVKRWILHGALDDLTSGGMGRPSSIDDWGKNARMWLSRLAGGAETIDGLAREGTGGGTVSHFRRNSEDVFDRNNESQEFNVRDEPI